MGKKIEVCSECGEDHENGEAEQGEVDALCDALLAVLQHKTGDNAGVSAAAAGQAAMYLLATHFDGEAQEEFFVVMLHVLKNYAETLARVQTESLNRLTNLIETHTETASDKKLTATPAKKAGSIH